MSRKPELTDDEFEEGFKESHSQGALVKFVFANVEWLDGDRLKAVSEILERLHNSGEIDTLAEDQWNSCEAVSKNDFFGVQHLFCEAFPKLSGSHRSMMVATQKLVQLGGEDLAANQPNAAFVSWCRRDLSRAMSVIDDARGGDKLALDHLTFALTAGNYFDCAVEFLSGKNTKARCSAAAAMGRMDLTQEQIQKAISEIIAAYETCDDPILVVNLFSAAYAISEKADTFDLAQLRLITELSSQLQSPNLQYQAASALHSNANKLDRDCIEAITVLLKRVKPEHRGVLDQIDFAIPKMIDAGFLDIVLELLEHVVIHNSGEISIGKFNHFIRKVSVENKGYLSEIAARWLLEGNLYICSGFAESLKEETKLELNKSDLPLEHDDIIFICRKAVGHFFMKPLLATSVLLSVIKHSNPKSADEAAKLLFDPLLTSYGGKVREQLEDFCNENSDPEKSVIQGVLDQKIAYLDKFEGIEKLVELHPSEKRRQAERARWQEVMRQSTKEAHKQSVLLSMVSKQTLLYGVSSLTFIEEDDGSYRQLDTKLGQFSTEFEYPKMDIIDPVGLKHQLYGYKVEQRSKS